MRSILWLCVPAGLLWLCSCGDSSSLPDGSDGDGADAADEAPPGDDGGMLPDGGDENDAGSDPGLGDAVEDGGVDGGMFDADGESDGGLDGGQDAGPDAGGDEDGDSGGGDTGGSLQGCLRGTGYRAYFGNLHSHSKYSDGDCDADLAYTWARDQAHLDIMILTDHIEQLYWPLDEYQTCLALADSFYVPGQYLAGCGFEYATAVVGLLGHNNVFFSPTLFPLVFDFEAFYPALAGCGTCIGAFNHPGDSAGHTWKDFVYDGPADERLNLFEFNGDGPVWDLFFQALDKGWHLSPTYNQDNHGCDWGTKNDNRSGFFLPELTREALYQAMLERRSFATTDKNATIVMMAQGECWMGSILRGTSYLDVQVTAADPDPGDAFTAIEFYGPQKTLLSTFDCAGANPCTAELSIPVIGSTYVVARATMQDGGFLVAAPVWAAP